MEKDPLSNLLLFQNYHLKKFLNVMRITSFLLFLCVFASFATNTSSQNAKVNISGSNMRSEILSTRLKSRRIICLFIVKAK